jgi:methylenetetrahydrofolate--tRNA-(uracil-5-)-methyltransferase
MLGGLYRYLRDADPKHFQPMNANFGLLDPLDDSAARAVRGRSRKEAKKEMLIQRAQGEFDAWLRGL